MRVAVNVEQLLHRSPGGIGRYTARLVRLLPTLFPEDQVIAFSARHRGGKLAAAARTAGLEKGATGAQIVSLGLPRPLLYDAWHVLGGPSLRFRRPELAGVDVVHAPSVAVPPRGGVPLVVTVHDVAPALWPAAFSRRGRRFHRQGLLAAARRADLVITVSHAAASEIAAHSAISPDRIRVVANGLDRVEVAGPHRAAALARFGLDGVPYVLWVGSLEPRKGVGTLVRAMGSLGSSAGEHRLVLAGYPGWRSVGLIDPEDRALLGNRLRLLGPLEEADLWALYAGASVFALPSLHEGFGLPVLEAMSQRVAVVCSDIPALREVAGDAARFVAPGDAGAWAESLADVIGDEAARTRLGQAGFTRSLGFSWEATVRATRAVYEEARLAAPSRRGR